MKVYVLDEVLVSTARVKKSDSFYRGTADYVLDSVQIARSGGNTIEDILMLFFLVLVSDSILPENGDLKDMAGRSR